MSLNVTVITTIYLFIASLVCIYSQIEIVPERGGVYEINKKHVRYGKFFVNRHGRKSIYYANMEFELYNEVNNNCSVEIVFYEKLGNVYKRSFIEIKLRLCDLVNNDQFFGTTVRDAGIACPVPRGDYHMLNMTLKRLIFPYKWPFEYARGDAKMYQTETKEFISSGYLYFHIKQRKAAKRSKKSKL